MEVKSPKGNFLFGHLGSFLNNPISMMQESVKECGYRTKLRFLHRRFYILTHPEDVTQVLIKQASSFHKGPGSKKLSLVFGQGLLTSDGEHWKRNTKLIRPFFSSKEIDQLIPEMRRIITESWEAFDSGSINAHKKFNKLTLDLITHSLFSKSLGEDANEFLTNVTELMSYVVYRLRQPLSIPLWVPTKKNLEFKSRRQKLNNLVSDIIAHRSKFGEKKDDILQALLDARDESGNKFDEKQLTDEMITLLFAGHETIGSTVTFTMILLAQNPEWMLRLRDEADEIWSYENQKSLRSSPLTLACLEESMRIWPSAWSVSRTAIKDIEWNGLEIKKGDIVNLLPLVTHRDPLLWDEPLKFNPNRFLGEERAKQKSGIYNPFGAGPRMCVGRGMALMEGILIISYMVKNYTWKILEEKKQELDIGITLRPTTNVQMEFKRRAN